MPRKKGFQYRSGKVFNFANRYVTYISIALGLVCLGVSSTPMGSQYDSLRGAPGAVDQLLMLAGVALLDAAWRLEHSGYKKNKGK